MVSPIDKTVEETNEGEQEENLAFELNGGPKGLSSLRKLMKGFCGGGFFGGSGVELPPDSLHNGPPAVHPKVDTNIDSVPNLKMENISMSPSSLGDNVCNDTLATTDSSLASVSEEKPVASGRGEVKNIEVEDQGDAIEIQVMPANEKQGAQDEEVVKRGMDDTEQDGKAATKAEPEEEEVVVESEEEVVVSESTNSNGSRSFGMLFILCLVLAAVATTVFFPDFREHGLEKLGLYIQHAVETELVQSTQKLVQLDVDEIVKEAIDETQSNDKKKTKRAKKNKASPIKQGQEAPEKEQMESRPKTEDSQSKSKFLASLEEAMDKESDSSQALTQVGDVVATNLVKPKEDEDDSVNSKENTGNPSKADIKEEASAKKNVSENIDDDIAKTFQRPAFVRPPSKEKERVSEVQDEL